MTVKKETDRNHSSSAVTALGSLPRPPVVKKLWGLIKVACAITFVIHRDAAIWGNSEPNKTPVPSSALSAILS